MLYFIGVLVVIFGLMMVISLLVNYYVEVGFVKKILVELNFGVLVIVFVFVEIMFLVLGVFNFFKLFLGIGGVLILVFILLVVIVFFVNYGVSGLDDV